MMKTAIIGTLTIVGMVIATHNLEHESVVPSAKTDLLSTASVTKETKTLGWIMSKIGDSRECFLDHKPGNGPNEIAPRNQDICSKIHADVVSSTSLLRDDRGNLIFVNIDNQRLFEFSSAEFEGYESIYPEHPLLTLEAQK